MQVTNVSVSFMREKQPAKFEKSQPSVEFTAVLDDGECYLKAARTLMYNAATVVYAGIGFDVPEKVAAALRAGETPVGATTVTNVTNIAAPAVEAPVEAEAVEEKPKTRGRPKGTKNTQPKKNSAADTTKVPVDTSEVPGDDVPNIRSNPEDRVDPVAEEEAALSAGAVELGEIEYTAKDLHDFVADAIANKKMNANQYRQLLAPFKVGRPRDLTPEQALLARDAAIEMLGVA